MLKSMVMLIMLGLILSSCQEIAMYRYAIEDSINKIKIEREVSEAKRKDSSGAILNEKYTKGVEDAINEVYKRNISKKVNFGNATLLIPEDTKINSENGTIVDLKSGYGLPIYFIKEDYCYNSAYIKKINGEYYRLSYYGNSINNLAKKISKVNGFTKGCK